MYLQLEGQEILTEKIIATKIIMYISFKDSNYEWNNEVEDQARVIESIINPWQ